jgi:LAO/AO transport system kinase
MMNDFLKKILNRDLVSIAKLLRLIEKEDEGSRELLKSIYPHTGNAHIIGITGLPGSGKSTIIDKLIEGLRSSGKTVAVIAVDPTSPYTGGAILGDRIRMQKHSTDPGIFIKSIPTSGWHGGISKVTTKMVSVMDAAGYDIILIETVGVGQAEVEIAKMVHTTVVVLVGGLGDYIQVIKAGILEIADIYVINKIDKNDAGDLQYNLKNLREPSEDGKEGWDPPVLLTQATGKKGIGKLLETIKGHRQYLESTGNFSRFFKERFKTELKQILSDHIDDMVREKIEGEKGFNKLMEGKEKLDPYSAAEEIINILFDKK